MNAKQRRAWHKMGVNTDEILTLEQEAEVRLVPRRCTKSVNRRHKGPNGEQTWGGCHAAVELFGDESVKYLNCPVHGITKFEDTERR